MCIASPVTGSSRKVGFRTCSTRPAQKRRNHWQSSIIQTEEQAHRDAGLGMTGKHAMQSSGDSKKASRQQKGMFVHLDLKDGEGLKVAELSAQNIRTAPWPDVEAGIPEDIDASRKCRRNLISRLTRQGALKCCPHSSCRLPTARSS